MSLLARLEMTERAACSVALAGLGLLSACNLGEPPQQLRLELPDVIISKEPVLLHARAVAQDGSVREASGNLEFKVTPPDLATVAKSGLLSCNRSGEGKVSLTVSGVEGHTKFACKLAARIQAPNKLSLDAVAGEIDAPVKVLDSASKELDLPISLTSDFGSVVLVRSGRLVPGNVGNAKLTARVGELTHQIDVEVVRTLKPEVLPVDQNRRISYSLDAGRYRLSMLLPSPHKVSVDWLGAPYCAYRGNGTEHVAECNLQDKGSVSFDNPAFLLRGDKTPSIEGVTLREVP